MPVISLKRDLLFEKLGQFYTDEKFASLCFDYGLELDEITTEKQSICKEKEEKSLGLCDEIVYKIDIPANRYDLLCMEGFVRSILIFLKKLSIPQYKLIEANSALNQITVTKSTKSIRPYVLCAILRNLKFDKNNYDSFIDLQDKLHQNICKKRSLASIGTHDLDKIQGPFVYTVLPPKDIKFIPLNESKEYNAAELMNLYNSESHLKVYLPIIKNLPLYPVIFDKDNNILSLPPIINSNLSKITLNTKNVFIEVTATDLHKAKIVLDIMITMFSEYCENKFTVEPVKVLYEESNETFIYPELKYRNEIVNIDYINKLLGIKKDAEEILNLLLRMGLKSKILNKNDLEILIPPTRHDILHACDIAEDVGISFGYNNIKKTFPNAITVGNQLPINKLTDQLRFELSRCGYTEGLSFSLCSKEDISEKLLQSFESQNAIEISNPKTIEFQVGRTTLLPGILKTINSNKKISLPLKIFEVSDVILKNEKTETGCQNERRICVVYYNKTPGFELIHGILDRIMQMLEIPYSKNKSNEGYFLKECDNKSFLPKRCAEVIVKGKVLGFLGILHPKVVLNFELSHPCSVLEISIQNLI